jgi:hypothetical protein
VRVRASNHWQTVQAITSNYTCHFLSAVSLGFSFGLPGAVPAADETTPLQCSSATDGEGLKEVTQFLSFTLVFDARLSTLVRSSVHIYTTMYLSSSRDLVTSFK